MGTSSTVDVTYVSLDKPLDYSSVNSVILGIVRYFMYRLMWVVLAVSLMFVKAYLVLLSYYNMSVYVKYVRV